MMFDSFQAFVDMGGYGFYVWLSYGLSLFLLIWLAGASIKSHKQTKKQIKQKLIRKMKLREAAQLSSETSN